MWNFMMQGHRFAMLSLKTNGLVRHAKGMSLHSDYFDTVPYFSCRCICFTISCSVEPALRCLFSSMV